MTSIRGGSRYTLTLAVAALVAAGPVGAGTIDRERTAGEALERLQAYIRVDTTNPPGHETPAAELLRGWLATEGIEARLYDPMNNPERQALVARIPGQSGRTIVLMSHSDVVPAIAADWHHPPFAAEVHDGMLYGRGTQDTKALGILQLMTLVTMRRQGLTPRDEILLLIEPDEEEDGGGARGMLEQHPELFANTRMVLNEGGSGTRGLLKPGQIIFFVQTSEKGAAWIKLTARGDTGHASVPLPNNAVVTMARALERVAAYETPLRPSRAVIGLFETLSEQLPFPNSFVMRHVDNPIVQRLFRRQLTERPLINAMLRTTISLTQVHGGYKTNVIPSQVEAFLDCRVTVGDSAEAIRSAIERVIDDQRVTVELTGHSGSPNESPIDEGLMAAVRDVAGAAYPGSLVAPLMTSGVTDSAFFRERQVPAYGLNPIVVSEAELTTAHGNDERVPVAEFSTAVHMYYDIVARLAGVAD